MRPTDPTTENPSTVANAGELLERAFLRVLGVDDRGRKHCFQPATGEILVRDETGATTETVDRIDTGAKTIHDYREFVDNEVDDLEVDWYDRVFRGD